MYHSRQQEKYSFEELDSLAEGKGMKKQGKSSLQEAIDSFVTEVKTFWVLSSVLTLRIFIRQAPVTWMWLFKLSSQMWLSF